MQPLDDAHAAAESGSSCCSQQASLYDTHTTKAEAAVQCSAVLLWFLSARLAACHPIIKKPTSRHGRSHAREAVFAQQLALVGMPKARTKVVLRRLPVGLTEEKLLETLPTRWEKFSSHARFLYFVAATEAYVHHPKRLLPCV